ncbi:unnamed protein product [Peronospora belbahrii]|uniref:Uncharacterized protein n=1 Tax=Peronospora belbahrii TaxID=622444 RepID=A0ABN8DAR7_9STRA|nr:unnamed protein product [Peronospora belbahrii]
MKILTQRAPFFVTLRFLDLRVLVTATRTRTRWKKDLKSALSSYAAMNPRATKYFCKRKYGRGYSARKYIESLSDEKNIQLQKALDFKDQAYGTVSTCSGEAVLVLASESRRGKKI